MLIPQATEQDTRSYQTAMLAQANQERLARAGSSPASLTGSTGTMLMKVGSTLSSWGRALQGRSTHRPSYRYG